ncbi:hypothetical protein MBLNU457_g2470t1 [Dothideomycetes sp. NU457]
MKFARMDYRDYINRLGSQELVRLLIEKERQTRDEEESSPTISDDASSRPFFSSNTTPMGPLARVADGADSADPETSNVVTTSSAVTEEPSTSPQPLVEEAETAQASDVSMNSPSSARAVSMVSRRSNNPSTSSRSSHTHKWLGTHQQTKGTSSPPQPPLLTVDPIEAAPTSASSRGKSPATSPPPRSHQALQSLKGMLQNSKIPHIFPRPELKAPENETPAHKRQRRSSYHRRGSTLLMVERVQLLVHTAVRSFSLNGAKSRSDDTTRKQRETLWPP